MEFTIDKLLNTDQVYADGDFVFWEYTKQWLVQILFQGMNAADM